MSTYAVFGMTEHFAREEACKKAPTSVGGRQITMDEWREDVEKRVARIMSGKLVVQLSGMFDAPQFAEQFVRLMQADTAERRDIHIRARVRVAVDPNSKSKRAFRLEWKDVA